MAEQRLPSGEQPDTTTKPNADATGSASQGAVRRGGLTGRRLGDYQLGDLLGVGGMAAVYRAYDGNLQREVAVKVLSGQLARDTTYVDHFRTEARRVAALSHPHLVPMYQAGEDEVEGQRILFLVMPLLSESLHDLLRREGRLPYAEAAWLTLQVAEGLEAAHRFGLVHRDVKPENILLDAEGQAMLGDFGVARDLRALSLGDAHHTWTGMAVGTPEYMAPEQLRGEGVDQRADIYALGAVLYETLTGKLPFPGSSPYEIAAQALDGPLLPPSTLNPDISLSLDRVVLTAMARDPNERYPDMNTFMLALRRAISHPVEMSGAFRSAKTLPPATPIWPSQRAETVGMGRSSNRRRLMIVALAAVVLAVSLAGAFLVFQRSGSVTALTSAIASRLPGASATTTQPATPTGVSPSPTLVPGGVIPTPAAVTPGMTPQATGTPPAQATATPLGTATPTPVSTLNIAPMPLVLTEQKQGKNMCVGMQTITNNTGQTVGWSWQGPPKPGFHFQIDGRPPVNWPTMMTNTPPGGQDTLAVTSDCKTKSANIVVNDNLGNQYTFSLTIPES